MTSALHLSAEDCQRDQSAHGLDKRTASYHYQSPSSLSSELSEPDGPDEAAVGEMEVVSEAPAGVSGIWANSPARWSGGGRRAAKNLPNCKSSGTVAQNHCFVGGPGNGKHTTSPTLASCGTATMIAGGTTSKVSPSDLPLGTVILILEPSSRSKVMDENSFRPFGTSTRRSGRGRIRKSCMLPGLHSSGSSSSMMPCGPWAVTFSPAFQVWGTCTSRSPGHIEAASFPMLAGTLPRIN